MDRKSLLMSRFPKKKKQSYKFRSFSKKNVTKFIDALNSETWENIYDKDSVDTKNLIFNSIISYHYNSSFQLVTKNNFQNDNSWITTGIKASS